MKKLIKQIKKSFEISSLIQNSKETKILSKEPTEKALTAQEKLKKYSKKEQNKAELTVLISLLSILLLVFSPTIFISIFLPSSLSHQSDKQETQSLQVEKQEQSNKEKFEKEQLEKEERSKKEKELTEKKAKEEAQKKIDDCKNSGGDWLEYSNKCYTKEEKLAAKEASRKSCITRQNYTWDGENCIGKVWYWQGNDRSLNSDSRVSSNESKIANEVFDAIERKSKNVRILDSGDGKPWSISIKMNGDSVSEYTAVLYIIGNGRIYRVIVKNGIVLN